jgi:hypothetical protein
MGFGRERRQLACPNLPELMIAMEDSDVYNLHRWNLQGLRPSQQSYNAKATQSL